MFLAIFTSVGSGASIFGLAFQLYKHKKKSLNYSLLAIALVCSVTSAIIWTDRNRLESENEKFKNARLQTEKILKSWPDIEEPIRISGGEFRGIVISGMAFLEGNKEIFPDTYSIAKILMFDELGVASNSEKNGMPTRMDLQQAAETIVTTIKAIRLN